MDTTQANALTTEIKHALQAIAKKHGLDLTKLSGRFDDVGMKLSIEIKKIGAVNTNLLTQVFRAFKWANSNEVELATKPGKWKLVDYKTRGRYKFIFENTTTKERLKVDEFYAHKAFDPSYVSSGLSGFADRFGEV